MKIQRINCKESFLKISKGINKTLQYIVCRLDYSIPEESKPTFLFCRCTHTHTSCMICTSYNGKKC